MLKVGTQVSSWVDAEFRLSKNHQRIELDQKNTTNQIQFDELYDVSGLFKFKLQGQDWAKNANVHAILGYNFSQYKTRELAGNVVRSEVNKQTHDGFMYGVGANLKLAPKHALEVSYLALQSRESFDNTYQLKRDSIGISWLYFY
ncbi:outer membrane beta-barrel protein [Thiomicrospira sp.]|uniref:outer membrane beta-barrel protein n=1 Tax=Thiomicrospira sp. TaxID=935 RepID=UPI0025F08D78|nr:outer membrane beta-barrel protein [Thiomicrospira sp.]